MKLLKTLATAFSLAALLMIAAPSASADDWNRETVVTFSGPVEVPGVGAQVLPAGTYVFKILDSQSDRHIVQIFNQEKTHVYTTIIAIPNFRLQTTDETVITFRERPAGQPEALRAWFYPGREWGEEFVYAKPRAVILAKETNQPILETPIEIDAAPVEVLKAAPVEVVTPSGERAELATVVQAPPSEPVTVASNEELPKTAGSLPLIGLIGLLSLGGGYTISSIAKKYFNTRS